MALTIIRRSSSGSSARTEWSPRGPAAILDTSHSKRDNVDKAVPIGIETVSNPAFRLQNFPMLFKYFETVLVATKPRQQTQVWIRSRVSHTICPKLPKTAAMAGNTMHRMFVSDNRGFPSCEAPMRGRSHIKGRATRTIQMKGRPQWRETRCIACSSLIAAFHRAKLQQ